MIIELTLTQIIRCW